MAARALLIFPSITSPDTLRGGRSKLRTPIAASRFTNITPSSTHPSVLDTDSPYANARKPSSRAAVIPRERLPSRLGSAFTKDPSLAPRFGSSGAEVRRPVVATSSLRSDVLQDVASEESEPTLPYDDPASSAPDGSQNFVWKSNWYGIQIVADIDETKPHPLTILGRNMVLWCNSDKEWVCFLDECPHRLAPLSEGRLDNGELQCSYHGWKFSGDGKCVNIPQARTEGPESRAKYSPRACAVRFPTTVAQGIIFVWPDEDGWERALATRPPLVPELDDPSFHFSGIVRDLEYGYELLAENFVDASHLPFAHHGVGRLRRQAGKPLNQRIVHNHGVLGFEGYSDEDVMPSEGLTLKFMTPSLSSAQRFVVGKDKKRKRFIFNMYITPVGPSNSRAVLVSGFNFPPPPKWLTFFVHIVNMRVFDGDSFILHAQQRALLTKGDPVNAWKQYFMPALSDLYVITFRQWMNKYAGGKIQWPQGVDPIIDSKKASREIVMDRFNSHTKHCRHCTGMHEFLKKAQVVAAIASFALLFAVAFSNPSNVVLRVVLGISSAILGAASYKLGAVIQEFVYVGYDHSKIK